MVAKNSSSVLIAIALEQFKPWIEIIATVARVLLEQVAYAERGALVDRVLDCTFRVSNVTHAFLAVKRVYGSFSCTCCSPFCSGAD